MAISGLGRVKEKSKSKMKKEMIKRFYNVMLYGKQCFTNLNIESVVEICVHKAYLSICRSFNGISEKTRIKLKSFLKEGVIKLLHCKTKLCFDNLHEEICNQVYDKFKYNAGITQHLVNLSLKFFFCINEYYNYREINNFDFNWCHFDLCKCNMEYLVEKKVIEKVIKLKDMSLNEYLNFQKDINEYYKSTIVKSSAFYNEFEIWNVSNEK